MSHCISNIVVRHLALLPYNSPRNYQLLVRHAADQFDNDRLPIASPRNLYSGHLFSFPMLVFPPFLSKGLFPEFCSIPTWLLPKVSFVQLYFTVHKPACPVRPGQENHQTGNVQKVCVRPP